jgi:restriction endonuclease
MRTKLKDKCMNKDDFKFLTKEINIRKNIIKVFKKEKRHFKRNSVKLFNLRRIKKIKLFKSKENHGRI